MLRVKEKWVPSNKMDRDNLRLHKHLLSSLKTQTGYSGKTIYVWSPRVWTDLIGPFCQEDQQHISFSLDLRTEC